MNLISDFESERDYWAEQDAIEDLCEMVQIQREEIQKLEIELSGEKE